LPFEAFHVDLQDGHLRRMDVDVFHCLGDPATKKLGSDEAFFIHLVTAFHASNFFFCQLGTSSHLVDVSSKWQKPQMPFWEASCFGS
jgi:hypothetical protein